jgi:hypothetical protein
MQESVPELPGRFTATQESSPELPGRFTAMQESVPELPGRFTAMQESSLFGTIRRQCREGKFTGASGNIS